ncbi:helix-turn-helix domain-containing protein [Lachnoclostridium pacaense]|uniref:Zinc ribbon domain-containing protein n=1 Tax=Enterocloster hominis (ex Hitch et al. 2024) TaxID=1917870 RepID=A0ABV1DER4_9FIRM|nr:zinc ribbon domain-containing protein [Lachnoclostridium pacaense]EEQ56427.1 DNA-binding helix-turn-helix protein [Clostridiales bacterium 1_7_47FAA]MCC2879755.1 helix-turn-helix domain-containing protein [Lachnoclostridium pacaense]
MDTKDVLKNIRVKNKLTQDEMAERLSVTRQAVSRWENGDSTPNIETLKQISIAFDVSINTLLGSPRKLICQCCGMPLEDDSVISRETDNSFNEDYCKWCYTDGQFAYETMDRLLEFLVSHMSDGNFTPEQARAYFSEQLPKLKHWK